MKEEQFWLLVSLKLSGEANAEELAALDRLLAEHPEWHTRCESLDDWWNHANPIAPSLKKGALQRHLLRLNETEKLPAKRSRGRRLYLLAVGAAAMLGGLLFFPYPWSRKKPAQPVAHNTVSTKSGSRSKVQLPDGSTVWLNADSRIVYNESFGGSAREVHLCGEAYFDVVKDPVHPFVIHTKTIDLRVLGTSFNVRSYANEKCTEAVLIHGSVEVSLCADPGRKIILRPNDKLVVQNGDKILLAPGNRVARSPADTALVMSLGKAHFKNRDSVATEVLWVKNKLAFDKESLEAVAMKIEHWFNVKVSIEDEALKETEYSGVFEDETLPQVMEALRLTGNFRYSIRKRDITIRP